MARTEVELSESEQEQLESLSRRTGRSQSDLIREAIHSMLNRGMDRERLALLRRGRGIWKDRTDVPDVRELRRGWDRIPIDEV